MRAQPNISHDLKAKGNKTEDTLIKTIKIAIKQCTHCLKVLRGGGVLMKLL